MVLEWAQVDYQFNPIVNGEVLVFVRRRCRWCAGEAYIFLAGHICCWRAQGRGGEARLWFWNGVCCQGWGSLVAVFGMKKLCRGCRLWLWFCQLEVWTKARVFGYDFGRKVVGPG